MLVVGVALLRLSPWPSNGYSIQIRGPKKNLMSARFPDARFALSRKPTNS